VPSGAAVIRYDGVRGVVWRVKYRDADGRQAKETLGREADGWTRQTEATRILSSSEGVRGQSAQPKGPTSGGRVQDAGPKTGRPA
jgi:hypothetical protein